MKYRKCPFAAMDMELVNVLKVQSCLGEKEEKLIVALKIVLRKKRKT